MLDLTYVGTFWQLSGDLAYLTHSNGEQARIYVDSVGETWVGITRIPDGRVFHSERVRGYRVFNGAHQAEKDLIAEGYTSVRRAPFASYVVERD